MNTPPAAATRKLELFPVKCIHMVGKGSNPGIGFVFPGRDLYPAM